MHPEDLAGHRDRLEKVVDAMRQYHDKATFVNPIYVFDMIREYLEMARGIDAPFPDDIDWMLALCDDIEQAMKRDQPPSVACHCDLLSENFMLEADGKMWVIDWEYGGQTDPYFDLGDFCVEHPLSDDEERFIITRYCGTFDEVALRADDAAQDRRRPVVEHLGDDPGAAVEARLRLLRVRHEQGGAPPRERRQARVPVVARDRLAEDGSSE